MPLIPRAASLPAGRTVTRDAAPGEVRASSGSILSFDLPGRKGVSRWDAAHAFSEAYYSNVFVYGCVRAIATDLSARPFRVGADPENPRDFDPKHPLAQRLGPPPKGPNPTTSARALWRWSIAQRLVAGAFAWEIDPATLTFWPLLITRLKPEPSKSARPQDGWFSEFLYDTGDKDPRRIPASKVFYDWFPAQDEWRLPESPLDAARLDVSVAVMQDKYDHAFLLNDARPATVIVHESFQSDAEERKFRRQFLQRHQGPANAGKVMFAASSPSGATAKDSLVIHQLGLSQRDSRSVERYDKKLRAITVAYGVPLSRLGDASERTFSNADRETLNYWRDTVQPLGNELQDAVNMRLMPLFDNSGNVGFFDWTGVPDLEPIKRFAVGDIPALKASRIITTNEARDVLGLAPIEGGDELEEPVVQLVQPTPDPNAPAPVADETNIDAPPPAAADERGRPAPLEARESGDRAEQAIRAAKERRARLWRQVDRSAKRLEAPFQRRIQNILDEQRVSVLKRLEGKRGRQAMTRADETPIVDSVFDKAYWRANLSEAIRDLYAATVATSFNALEASLEIAFDLDAPFAQAFILDRSNQLARKMTDTTYEAIKDQLARGALEGESIPDLAARIDKLFNVTWNGRAEMVARTEVISAYNGSAYLAAQEAPSDVVGGLEWISTLDDRVRPEHAAMDGTVIGRGEAFVLDGAVMLYPGDPGVTTNYNSAGEIPDPASEIINCRCTVAPVIVDDMPPRERSVPREHAERAALLLASGSVSAAQAIAMLSDGVVRKAHSH